MLRFLTWTALLLVVEGLLLHFQVDLPFVSNWLGKLPGDMYLKRDGITLAFPLASAAISGLIFTLIFSAIFSKK